MKQPNSLFYTFKKQSEYFVIYNSNNPIYSIVLHRVLNGFGFGFVTRQYHVETNYLPIFVQIIRDQYLQTWNDSMFIQAKLTYLCLNKKDFVFENYVNIVKIEEKNP